MKVKQRSAEYYRSASGREPAKEFIDALDTLDGVIVSTRIRRAESGNFGDHKRVGRLFELRIDHGPGYRVYFSIEGGDTIILLLVVGDKSSQGSDIKAAEESLDDYCQRTKKAGSENEVKTDKQSKSKKTKKPTKTTNRKR